MTSTAPFADPQVRQSGLGGSDAAAAVGLHPYRTPLELYLEKVGETEPFEGNAATKWGNILEEPVANEYAERTGNRIARVNKTLRTKEFPWAFAHVDRRIVGSDPKQGLEVKTGGFWSIRDWGAEGTDEVPVHYLIQAQHYLAVTGWAGMDIAALLNTHDFRIYAVERNDRLIEGLMRKEAEFWQRVEKREPPEPINLKDCDLRWAESLKKIAFADDAVRKAVLRIAEIKAALKQLVDEHEAIELDVKAAMAEADTLHAEDGTLLVTWKTSKGFAESAFKKAHADLWKAHAVPKLDRKSLEKAERKLYAKFKTMTGSRRFLVKVKEQND